MAALLFLWSDFPDFADLVGSVAGGIEAIGFAKIDGLNFLSLLSQGVDDGGNPGRSLGREGLVLLGVTGFGSVANDEEERVSR